MKHRIVIARPMTDAVSARARREFDAVLAADSSWDLNAVLHRLEEHRAAALVTWVTIRMDAAALARLPQSVRVLATCSVGYDHIDVVAARARGLVVTNTPDVLTDCTADFTMLLILAACRRAHEYDAIMRAGWGRAFAVNEMLGLRVSGKTLGILGMGRIGRAVARRARGFGMRVLYHDVQRLPADMEEDAEYVGDFSAMLPRCQILSLHAPGGAKTDRIMNRKTFALLPKGAVLVNAARGALVDEEALIEALQSGHLFAAGLDVFRREPDFERRLAALPNVFLAPHMASATEETRTAMGMRTLDNIAAVLGGGAALDPV
jgi:lactate dehydrogenase-like 2-hydroxyacid dehydrogenase